MTTASKPLADGRQDDGPDMYRKYGDLSMFAFACGYVQTVGGVKEFTDAKAYMYHDVGCYHVRRPLAEGEKYHLQMGWDTFDSVVEARRHLRKFGPFTNHRDGGVVHPKQMK